MFKVKNIFTALFLSTSLFLNTAVLAETTIYDIKGNLPDLKFDLKKIDNDHFTEKNLQGKIVLVFFGYASCPDICPTTMAELSELRNSLNKEQVEAMQIIFISVDPHRDTPKVLQAYVDAFNNGAIGLTGSEKEIADIAKRYRVAYQIGKPKPGDDVNNYEVMHAQGIYIFDRHGKARLLSSNGEDTDKIKQKLETLFND